MNEPTPPQANQHLFVPRKVPPEQRDLGRFRLLHELGTGGMATLYLATDEMGRMVGIKRLHPHLAAERSFVEMFTDEATITARISHPHVCKVHGLEQSGGHVYIIMEYVHGESLSALMHQAAAGMGQLPLEVALHLAGQACLGLHAAHELKDQNGRLQHLVHRDVSPQNLLVTYEGELKVVDFGIAAAASKLHHTEAGGIKGKYRYMAPEQARGEAVDRRADIFALGAVLYEALCGVPCFGGSGPQTALGRQHPLEQNPPRRHRPDLPLAAEQILLRALSPEPQDRFASASDMYRELYNILVSSSGMTTRAIGDLMKRVFARRYPLREELMSLAFSAPDVLEEEELALDLAGPAAAANRCDYCGSAMASEAELQIHQEGCAQRLWWQQNFGGDRQASGVGELHRDRIAQATETPGRPAGLWQRMRHRLSSYSRDPLVVRLKSIEARLQGVRHYRASQLSEQALAAIWGMVSEITENKTSSENLLSRLKPQLLRCANILLGISLEIEGNATFLASSSDRTLLEQIAVLESRMRVTSSAVMLQEMESTIRRKRGLLAERQRLSERNELLLLRLESMVDAVDLTHGKVLEIAASPVMAQVEATTQITVFLDSLLLEVEGLAASVREADSVR